MNILTHMGAALASTEALHCENDGMMTFFGNASRHRAEFGWGPRQRRRDRNRRRDA
ncbi:hypothetical protein JCM17844_08720 [Iodidimonas gelatinilytica]|uniref:Uncharacterized protein n=2 Tax=Iodidimonas TaxID=2066486 RepID=A0A5A7MQJ9_9PROT|nr:MULTISPECIES: hypothetical protein [Iodidimonas]GEQ97235.1 hypothetical protein JCM17844_08720 [Iodidimonas gelatinilytica]GEQ99566.1 hypothetical protein JCM17845_01900 [Iodidimonas gelatinilytica]GER07331.1 hypothetical protein JCM17843_16410 [Kordiimonadales bacterium JCM 17843]GGO10951.1 hypothetical protein GCM10007972_14270 [Iodidimonas muriae]